MSHRQHEQGGADTAALIHDRSGLGRVPSGRMAANGPEAGHYHRLVAQGKPKGVAIAAPARHLLVLASQLLTKDEPCRRVDAAKFADKLQRWAAFRPPTEELEPTPTAWAAERLETPTSLPAPYEQEQPRSRSLRRRKGGWRTDPLKEVTEVIARALAAPA